MGTSEENKAKSKSEVLKLYLKISKQVGGKSPTIAELEEGGLTRNRVRGAYGTRQELDTIARTSKPGVFKDTPLASIEAAAPTKQTLIITCPVVGAPAHVPFCKALRQMADARDADIIALPVADPASKSSPNGVGRIDKQIVELGFQVASGDIRLNDNLSILGIEISAKQLVPISGLDRFGQRGSSIIIPAPKRFLRFVPTSSTTPHVIMTPGACTIPNYDTDTHRSKRTAYLAAQDHAIGAIIVEIEDDKRFHFRQLTWSEAGRNVVDLGETHTGKTYRPQALHLGDWHSGSTADANYEFAMQNTHNARWVFLHDSFDGSSVNPHESELSWLSRPRSLLEELESWTRDLDNLASVYERVYVVRSNHDEWLVRWLSGGKHLRDRVNYKIARELEGYFLDGKEPLQAWYESRGSSTKVHFLSKHDSLRIGGVEMAHHGHRGPNGSRSPNLRSFEAALGACCVGHSHTPGIYREAWQAGTSTELRLDYTAGPSSWFWSHILVYPDGRRQMINLIP